MRKILQSFYLGTIFLAISCADNDEPYDIVPQPTLRFADENQLKKFVSDETFKRFASQSSDKVFTGNSNACTGSGSFKIDYVNQQLDFTSCFYSESEVKDGFIYPEYFSVYGIKQLTANTYASLQIVFVEQGIPETGRYQSTQVVHCFYNDYCQFFRSHYAEIFYYSLDENGGFDFSDRYTLYDDTFELQVVNFKGAISLSFDDVNFTNSNFYPFPTNSQKISKNPFYDNMSVSGTLSCCLKD